MATGFFNVPPAINEPILSYAPGSPEKEELQAALKEARSKEIDVPMYIGSELVTTDNKKPMSPPVSYTHLTLPTICSV